MAKLAVDVALLLSEEMMDKAIEINKELLKKEKSTLVLDKEKCLPHISLAMGVIDEKYFPEIKKILEEIASKFPVFHLSAVGIHLYVLSPEKKFSDLKVQKTKRLQQLHEIVMKRLSPYVSEEVNVNMLYRPPEPQYPSLDWIRDYFKKHCDPNAFHPHVTVGKGNAEYNRFPIEFTASKLVLCHLGDFCTCRRVLVSVDLKK